MSIKYESLKIGIMKRKNNVFATALLFSLFLAGCGGTSDTERSMASNEDYQEPDVMVFADLPPNEDQIVEPFSEVDNTEDNNILSLAAKDGNFSTFRMLAAMGNLDQMLQPDREYTVFMPTNEAFREMPKEKFEELVNPNNRAQLGLFLQRHILAGEYMPLDFEENQVIENSSEEEITVSTNSIGDLSMIGGANVIGAETDAANGVIYAVDAIVQPTKNVFSE